MLAVVGGTDKPVIPKLRLRLPPGHRYVFTDTPGAAGGSVKSAGLGDGSRHRVLAVPGGTDASAIPKLRLRLPPGGCRLGGALSLPIVKLALFDIPGLPSLPVIARSGATRQFGPADWLCLSHVPFVGWRAGSAARNWLCFAFRRLSCGHRMFLGCRASDLEFPGFGRPRPGERRAKLALFFPPPSFLGQERDKLGSFDIFRSVPWPCLSTRP